MICFSLIHVLLFTLPFNHDIILILWITWVLTSDGRLPYVSGLSVPLFTVARIDNPPTRLIFSIIRTPLSLHCPGMFAPSTNIVSFLSYQNLVSNQPMDMRKKVLLFLHNQTIRPGEFRKEFNFIEKVSAVKKIVVMNKWYAYVGQIKVVLMYENINHVIFIVCCILQYTVVYCCKIVPLLLGKEVLWLSTRTSDNRSAAEKKATGNSKDVLILWKNDGENNLIIELFLKRLNVKVPLPNVHENWKIKQENIMICSSVLNR